MISVDYSTYKNLGYSHKYPNITNILLDAKMSESINDLLPNLDQVASDVHLVHRVLT